MILKPNKDRELQEQLKKEFIRLKIQGANSEDNLPMPLFLKDGQSSPSTKFFKFPPDESVYVLGKFSIALEGCRLHQEAEKSFQTQSPISQDCLRDIVISARNQYRERLTEDDKESHAIRAGHKDSDLTAFFLSQKRLFDHSKKDQEQSDLGKWGLVGVWVGVLRRMQRRISVELKRSFDDFFCYTKLNCLASNSISLYLMTWSGVEGCSSCGGTGSGS